MNGFVQLKSRARIPVSTFPDSLMPLSKPSCNFHNCRRNTNSAAPVLITCVSELLRVGAANLRDPRRLLSFKVIPLRNPCSRHHLHETERHIREENEMRRLRKKVPKCKSVPPPPLLPQVFTVNLRENERSISPVRTPPLNPSIPTHCFIHTKSLKVTAQDTQLRWTSGPSGASANLSLRRENASIVYHVSPCSSACFFLKNTLRSVPAAFYSWLGPESYDVTAPSRILDPSELDFFLVSSYWHREWTYEIFKQPQDPFFRCDEADSRALFSCLAAVVTAAPVVHSGEKKL